MKQYLLCVARRREGHWEAICLDLDIGIEGRSFEDVQARLNKAVVSYIEAAMKKPDRVRDQLLNRRAPFLVRMQWLLPLLTFGKKYRLLSFPSEFISERLFDKRAHINPNDPENQDRRKGNE